MSDPNFEHSDGNWDDTPSEPTWGESQWRKYLTGSDRDTAKFLSIYNSLKDKPNHLDEVAIQMGWDAEDISLTDEFSAPEPEDEGEGETPFDAHDAPYTLHRHPVIVVTRALYRYLHQSWEHYMAHSQNYLSPQLCWKYANSLHQAEMNVLLSIQAIDLGDFGLTICHLKNSLSALNQTLALLDQVTHPDPEFLAGFRKENHIRIFDLREVWIRVMSDCRIECQRRPGGDLD
ncbi:MULTISPECIES: hypothetical protein [unclassified Lentimonas]|uniref:hypothetical protein n=1 Tax=unclassified Lentimonas TaxID=2630993 RepID=UPI001323662E|nr:MULTISPECIES: hypothetical protein [unclassified Lentimonas]CAA6678141.1 Unannotated [Lentimonas sp. CC4]CAA6685970.1 Unannotated [Lentimonas sp. CC6]CAA7075941.1 Unannotated [Lentimonas sp. CC4]CAA7168632.1 Unannotated [Lentimonas sp. CC21]CAA7181023.1 Unannotated [Lentimonas sp. CC8]